MSIVDIVAIVLVTGCASFSAAWVLIRQSVQKAVDEAIELTFAKKLARFNNQLDRKMLAYEMLSRKEFEFYEKLGPLVGGIVTDAQDLSATVSRASDSGSAESMKQYLLHHLEQTMEQKSLDYEYQSFVPRSVLDASTNVVKTCQDNHGFWSDCAKAAFGKDAAAVEHRSDEASIRADEILWAAAALQASIHSRLTEIAEDREGDVSD